MNDPLNTELLLSLNQINACLDPKVKVTAARLSSLRCVKIQTVRRYFPGDVIAKLSTTTNVDELRRYVASASHALQMKSRRTGGLENNQMIAERMDISHMNDLFMELPVAHSSSVNAKSGVRTYRQFRWSEVLSDLISKRLDSGKTTNRSTSTNLSVGLRAEIDTLKREFSRLDGQFKQLVSSLGGQISN